MIAALALAVAAHGQLRVVNYNVAQLGGVQPSLRAVFAALNEDDKPGWATAPHLYVFQEVRTTNVAPLLTHLNAVAPPGVTYVQGTYTNFGENSTAGAQAMFYRADMLVEDPSGHVDIFTQAGRYTDRWLLQLVGYDSPDARFYIYSTHLKASTGSNNQQLRLQGATAIREDADSLPPGTHIIYAGDFNVYNNGEPAYQMFISPGPGQAFDPLGTGSWGGAVNAIKHTQSPQLNGPLVGGGMDDRFDFQISTAAFHDGAGLSLISGTYRAFGNDGLHYDIAINMGDNFYYPDDVPRSNALANHLHDASDHVPVVAEYQLPAMLEADAPADLGRVIQGAGVSVPVEVRNTAAVVIPSGIGADALQFTVTGAGAVLSVAGGTAYATIPLEPVVVNLPLDTSAVGPVAGTLYFASTSQAAQIHTPSLPVAASVVRPARPSLDGTAEVDERSLSLVFQSDGGVREFAAPVWNLGFDADQALLDVTAADVSSGELAVVSTLPVAAGASPAELLFAFDTAGRGNGQFADTVIVHVSDEDIPGAQSATLTLHVNIETRVLLGDIDGDCDVGLDDLSALLQRFGLCAGDDGFDPAADLDNDGCVGISDLSALLVEFGTSCP